MLNHAPQKSQLTTPELLVISQLTVNSTIFGWLFAAEVISRKTNGGKLFLDLRLRDQRGNEIIARYFDPPNLETLLPQEGKVVLLEGTVEEYRSQVQIKLLRVQNDETIPVDSFTSGTRCSIVQLEADFQHLIDKIDHPGLSALLRNCFADDFMESFRRWPAAVRHHGAVVGGLLEHTVNVATIAALTAQLYPCQQDLVLAGALLHDIGKLEELEGQVGAGFTPQGRMVGHIVLGMHYVQEQTARIPTLEQEKIEDLLHIILAHHTKEYGSPVNPATIEALIVHQADLAEAHLTGFIEHCQRSYSSSGWTSFNPVYGGQLRLP
jgi:3'-5' exoribonuclease